MHLTVIFYFKEDLTIMKVCEKIAKFGTLPCSNSELLEVLLGAKGSKKLQQLLNDYDLKDVIDNNDATSNVLRIVSMEFDELKLRGSLTNIETCRVLAAVELGIRLAQEGKYKSDYFTHVGNPSDLASYLMPRLRYRATECFVVIMMNCKNQILGTKIISQGSTSATSIDIKDVFKCAIITPSCTAIAVSHNHPSGICDPSPEDISLTHVLSGAAIIMGIKMIDHVIIGDGSYYSFRENKMLEPKI